MPQKHNTVVIASSTRLQLLLSTRHLKKHTRFKSWHGISNLTSNTSTCRMPLLKNWPAISSSILLHHGLYYSGHTKKPTTLSSKPATISLVHKAFSTYPFPTIPLPSTSSNTESAPGLFSSQTKIYSLKTFTYQIQIQVNLLKSLRTLSSKGNFPESRIRSKSTPPNPPSLEASKPWAGSTKPKTGSTSFAFAATPRSWMKNKGNANRVRWTPTQLLWLWIVWSVKIRQTFMIQAWPSCVRQSQSNSYQA